MKPIIGVLPLWDSEKKSYWMLPGYMQGIEAAGGIPVMLPMTGDMNIINALTDMCDGFLFTGGQDVSPEIYSEKKKYKKMECCAMRDKTELMLLDTALVKDKAILGICRGIQFINAALGGTLFQDLPKEYKSKLEHHQSPPYDKPIHKVEIIRDTPLYSLVNKEVLAVNSYHHQAIKELSPQLTVMAKATDGITEAVYMENKKFVWAVQWHPEFSYESDMHNMKIFKAFIDASAGLS